MEHFSQIIQELLKNYQEIQRLKRWPKINVRIHEDFKDEGFTATYSGGQIDFQAQNYHSAIFGLSQLIMSVKSNHFADYLGTKHPLFFLRPLWVGCDSFIQLNSQIKIGIPRFLCDDTISEANLIDKTEFFCKNVLKLGYNAILFGCQEYTKSDLSNLPLNSFKQVCSLLNKYGIKTILKVDLPLSDIKRYPFNPSYRKALVDFFSKLREEVQQFEYIFWESGCYHPDFTNYPNSDDYLHSEIVKEELNLIESSLTPESNLIFYLPSKSWELAKSQAQWIPKLCDDVLKKDTVIAFSSNYGDYTSDHLSAHPIWHNLRLSEDSSSTHLMPILNIGSLRQGEGLWPILNYDLVESYVSRCFRHNFAGVMGVLNSLPTERGLLHCNLWTLSSYIWHRKSPGLLVETWFGANRPDFEYSKYAVVLSDIRKISVELSLLRSLINERDRDALSTEECRYLAENLLARLNQIQMKFNNEKKPLVKKEYLNLSDYFIYFARDSRRYIHHCLQCFNISLPNVLIGDNHQESLWTQITQGIGGQGIRSGTKITFLEATSSVLTEVPIKKIISENRLV